MTFGLSDVLFKKLFILKGWEILCFHWSKFFVGQITWKGSHCCVPIGYTANIRSPFAPRGFDVGQNQCHHSNRREKSRTQLPWIRDRTRTGRSSVAIRISYVYEPWKNFQVNKKFRHTFQVLKVERMAGSMSLCWLVHLNVGNLNVDGLNIGKCWM